MDTRLVPRVDIILKVISTVDEHSDQHFELASGNSFKVSAFNVGVMGMGIISGYFLPKGLSVDLKIDGTVFGMKAPMTLHGEVCYCRTVYCKQNEYRCGIRFLSISDEYKEAILRLCRVSKKEKTTCKKIKK